uniref:Mariner transposase n=1 Tax=Triatoma infestans TaxID=30076 RepID=A0A170W7J5_TRIIF
MCRSKKNSTDFPRRFVSMDETWVHHFTHESKQQFKQVGRSQWFCTEESKNNCIGQKGYG